jgi:hypothetical protein
MMNRLSSRPALSVSRAGEEPVRAHRLGDPAGPVRSRAADRAAR